MKREYKPMYVGLDFVRDENWKPRYFNYASAFKYMEKSRIEKKLFSTVIAEFDGYFRGSYAGQYKLSR